MIEFPPFPYMPPDLSTHGAQLDAADRAALIRFVESR